MIISYKRQFVFIHIYKTGGDSVAAALAPALGRGDVALKSDFQRWLHRAKSATHRSAVAQLGKHSPATAVQDYLSVEQWERLYTFAFVRHPISRAVSLYSFAKKKAEERRRALPRNMWYLTPQGRGTDPLRWPSIRAYNESASFSDFLRHPLVVSAPAMRPQWQAVCDDSRSLLVDYVGRFERLAEDFQVVQERIGLEGLSLPWRNSSIPRIQEPRVSVNAEDRALLAERFGDDFDLFSYDIDA